MFEFRRQPLRALYMSYFIITTLFVRLPFWLVTALVPSFRPRKTWTFKRSFIVPAFRSFIDTWFRTALPSAPQFEPNVVAASSDAGELGFTWCPPIPEDLLVGDIRDIAEQNGIIPEKTNGYWFTHPTAPEKPEQVEFVILHFHGGGYICTTAHPKDGANTTLCSGFFEHCPSVKRVFGGEYRLTSAEPFIAANPFPAALLDAAASYHYLLHTAGVQPNQVIISGDSAGGHLALSLVRYLAMHKFPSLPLPGGLLLISPTVDWVVTHVDKGCSMAENARTDYCKSFFRGYTARGLLGALPQEDAETNDWISPASLKLKNSSGLFKDFPKTYLLGGDAEICLDSYRTLRDRMLADIGSRLTYKEVKDATHDFLVMSWHEPERSRAYKDIAIWIESL